MNYKKINVNPFNKFTGDCSVRALAVALNKSYWVVLDELIAKQKKTGFSNEDIKCIELVLKDNGFEKHKQLRTSDNRHVQIKNMGNYIDTNKYIVITHIKHHLTTIIDNSLIDIGDCRDEFTGVFYTKLRFDEKSIYDIENEKYVVERKVRV